MLKITHNIYIHNKDIQIIAVRSQGAGGQNVNKVSSAVHLRFDIIASLLPSVYKKRLLELNDSRINKDGVIVIKSQQYRHQYKNKQQALERLADIIQRISIVPKKRKLTSATRTSQRKRVDRKVKHGQKKTLRQKISE